MKILYELPSQPRGDYVINSQRSYVSVICPEETINLVEDPEALNFGLNGTSYFLIIGGGIFPDADVQRRGQFGIRVMNPTFVGVGARYTVPTATLANQPYTFSVDHLGVGDFEIAILDETTRVPLAKKTFKGEDFWTRQEVTMYQATSHTVRLQVTTTSTYFNQPDFWLDGFQFEQKDHATTFVSGTDYTWLGGAHASPSYRSATDYRGGRPRSFDELGFQIYEILDFGLAKPELNLSRFATRQGSYFGGASYAEREVTLVGRICTEDFCDLLCQRRTVMGCLNLLSCEPTRFHFQVFDCLRPCSTQIEFDAVYSDGGGGEWKSGLGEDISLTFTMPDPFFYSGGERAAELDLYETVTDPGLGMVARNFAGEARAMPTNGWPLTGNAEVTDGLVASDGNLYVLALDSADNRTSVMRWNGFGWTRVAQYEGRLSAMAQGPGNNLYFGGTSVQRVGGAAQAAPTVFSYNVLTGVNGTIGDSVLGNAGDQIDDIEYHKDGYLIIGGNFTTMTLSAVTTTSNNVMAFNFNTGLWRAMGGDPGLGNAGDQVRALAIADDGTVWAGGTIDAAGFNSTVNAIGRYTFASNLWHGAGDYPAIAASGLPGDVFSLAFDINSGSLYIGGAYDSTIREQGFPSPDNPYRNIAVYSPPSAHAFDTGAILYNIEGGTTVATASGVGTSVVRQITLQCNGDLAIGGNFIGVRRQAGQIIQAPFTDQNSPSFAIARLTKWVDTETTLDPTPHANWRGVQMIAHGPCRNTTPSTSVDTSLSPSVGDNLFIGAYLDVGGLVSQTDTVDVSCSEGVRPSISIYGPGTLESIVNVTTGAAIRFDTQKMVLGEDEVITIDLAGAAPSMTSNIVDGSLVGRLSVGSSLRGFTLRKGENVIKANYDNLDANGAIREGSKIVLQWKPRYLTADAACGDCQ